MKILYFVPVASGLALAGCASTMGESGGAAPQTDDARATLVDAAGAVKATARLEDANGGVDIRMTVRGMPAGTYAFHIHQTAACTPPDFMSAGGHFNPTGAKHGTHAGDLPNITVGADGTANVRARIENAGLASGNTPVMDPDGAAMIIHAKPDDGVTDPTGNAGPRLACGPIVTK